MADSDFVDVAFAAAACSPVWRALSSLAEDSVDSLSEAVAQAWLVETRFSFDHDCSSIAVRA